MRFLRATPSRFISMPSYLLGHTACQSSSCFYHTQKSRLKRMSRRKGTGGTVRCWDFDVRFKLVRFGAGDGIRTRDINLGKVALYQLSYSRIWQALEKTTAFILSLS